VVTESLAEESRGDGPRPRMLVVDDEANLADLVRTWFEMSGWQVWTAGDGVAGLALAATCQPDLVVLDLMLPGVDGVTMLDELLRRDPGVLVVLHTARDTAEDRDRARAAGARAYVCKPCSLSALEDQVDQLMAAGAGALPS